MSMVPVITFILATLICDAHARRWIDRSALIMLTLVFYWALNFAVKL